MYIEYEKYCSNSLRKGRLQAFQMDFQNIFAVFNNQIFQCQNTTVKQFSKIAYYSQLHHLIFCRSQQQQEEEYIQILYQILTDNYFMSRIEKKQIFSIFSLYFIYCQLQRKRKINVNLDFLNHFQQFIVQNKNNSKKDLMIIAKKLFQNCLNFSLKTGIKTLLIKPNGQPARKQNINNIAPIITKKKIQQKNQQNNQQNSLDFITNLQKQLLVLSQSHNQYEKNKQKYNFKPQNQSNKLQCSDRYFMSRLKKLTDSYEKLAIQTLKKQQQKQYFYQKQ